MKRFIALTVVSTAVISFTICFAGPERFESKAVAPVVPECDWSGFYIGLNAGVAGLYTWVTDINDWWSDGTWSIEDTNFAAGGQAGYNWQKGAFVFGLEVDGDYLNTEHTQVFHTDRSQVPLDARWRGKLDFQGSLRARAGISVDQALIYATGGVALSHGKSGFYSEEVGYNAIQDEWQAGFVAGVGVEYAFNCHWSVRGEYLYSHYPTTNTTISGNDYYHFDIQNSDWVVRLAINYRFGGGR